VGRTYRPRPSGVYAPRLDPEPPIPGTWKHKADSGFIEVEYKGDSEDPIVVKAPSGRVYTFDTGEHCKQLVHPHDLNYLKVLGFV